MPLIDLSAETGHLTRLAADFDLLHTELHDLDVRPGSDALHRIAPRIRAVHRLVAQTLERLTVLDSSHYHRLPGSRTTLNALAAAAAHASRAAADLATAVYDNPHDDHTHSDGRPEDGKAVSQARSRAAVSVLAEHLASAALGLDRCRTALSHVVTGITADITDHPELAVPVERITAAQHAVLRALSKEGGTLYVVGRRDRLQAELNGSGARVNIATFRALQWRGLVRIVESPIPISLRRQGRPIRVTPNGLRALALHTANRTTTATAPLPPPQPTAPSRAATTAR